MALEPDTPERKERQWRTEVAYHIGFLDLASGSNTLGGGDQSVFFMLPLLEAVARAEGNADPPIRVRKYQDLIFRPYDQIGNVAQYALRQLLHDLEPERMIEIQSMCNTFSAMLDDLSPDFDAISKTPRTLNDIVEHGISRSEIEEGGLEQLDILEYGKIRAEMSPLWELENLDTLDFGPNWPLFLWGFKRLLYLKSRVHGIYIYNG